MAEREVVFVGLTRPAEIAGLPSTAFIIILISTLWLLLVFKSATTLLMGCFLYFLARLFCQKDINRLTIVGKSCLLLKPMQVLNKRYWQVRSYKAE